VQEFFLQINRPYR